MADAASRQPQVFIDHALPVDFVQRLRDAAKALDSVLGARVEAARRRVLATNGLESQLKRGRRAVRLLNAIMAPKLAQDADRLAAWDNARKVNGVPGGPALDAEDEPPVVKVA